MPQKISANNSFKWVEMLGRVEVCGRYRSESLGGTGLLAPLSNLIFWAGIIFIKEEK